MTSHILVDDTIITMTAQTQGLTYFSNVFTVIRHNQNQKNENTYNKKETVKVFSQKVDRSQIIVNQSTKYIYKQECSYSVGLKQE